MSSQKKLQILIDIRSTFGKKTGIGYYLENLLSELMRVDKRNQYILASNDSLDWQLPENFTLMVRNAKIVPWHIWLWWNFNIKRCADILFSPSSLIEPAFALRKTLLTIHDISPIKCPQFHTLKRRFLFRVLLRIALKKTSIIFADSEYSRQEIVEYLPEVAQKVVVLYPGLNSERTKTKISAQQRDKVLKKFGITGDFIFYLGVIDPRKNLENLVRAFREISNREVRLVLAGQKGWFYEKIFNLVEELNLSNRVLFLGYVSDQEAVVLYQSCKLFACPSLYEGFGFPVLEAMALGAPVLTSNRTSLTEVVDDCAVLVNPESVTDIAQKLEMMLSDKNLLESLRQKGPVQASKFSWEKSASSFISRIDEIIN